MSAPSHPVSVALRSVLRRRWIRRALYLLPLLVVAPIGGWLFVPSHHLAYASAGPGTSGAAAPTNPTSTTSSPTTIPPPVSQPHHTPALNSKPPAATTTNSPRETNPNAPKGVGGVTGQILYEQNCAACHGEDGLGTARSQHVSLRGVGEAAVDFQLTTGRMPRKGATLELPPYRGILPEADIKALDYYISTYISKGGPPIPKVDPAAGNQGQGGDLYRQDCAACHSASGGGGVLYNRYVPRITYATPTQVAEAIRTGPNQMPNFGPHEFSQKQLNDIVAYVTKDLEHPYDKGGNPLNHVGPIAEGFVILVIALPAIILFTRWIGQRG